MTSFSETGNLENAIGVGDEAAATLARQIEADVAEAERQREAADAPKTPPRPSAAEPEDVE